MRRVTLSTDRGLVNLSAVQVEIWFLWIRILLWIPNDIDICNVNGNGNDNGNGGEALRGSTGLLFGNSFYGSRFDGTMVY